MQNLGEGMTFDRESIIRAAAEVSKVKAAARDYIVPTGRLSFDIVDGRRALRMDTCNEKVFRVGSQFFADWHDAERAADASLERIVPINHGCFLYLTRTAERQLMEKLGIPVKFSDALVDDREAAHVLKYAVEELADLRTDRVMIRTIGDTVRAVLSDKYKIIDNADVFVVAAEAMQGAGAELWKARLSPDRMELFGVAKGISGEVRTDRPDSVTGWRWYGGDQPDVQHAACHVTNSETGTGSQSVTPSILRAVCVNFMLWGDRVSQIHLGRRRSEEGMVYADDTLKSEAETVWLKLRDTISTTFDPDKFRAYIDRLNGLTQQVLPEDTIKVVAKVASTLAISEERRDAVLKNLLGSRDLTRYGLVQSLTETAHAYDVESPDAAAELEEAGSLVASMADGAFRSLVSV